MSKLIAAINLTLDGFCDHTAINADEELHQHYNDLLKSAGTVLYGRITYQLMEFWRTVVENPTGNKSMDDFAVTMDNVPKIVFSNTLENVEWKTARLAKRDIKEEVLDLKQSDNEGNKNILVGSRSLIISLTNFGLIDEYQFCVHPLIAGNGLPLFQNISDKTVLKLINTKTFGSGAVALYYVREKSNS